MGAIVIAAQPIPLLILAGSDSRHGPIHPELSPEEVLSGYKGALPLESGKCLVAELIDRYRDTGRFLEPVLFGPRSIYQHLVDCEIIDVTSASLAGTLRAVDNVVRKRFPLDGPVAISACDILPTPAEISDLLGSGYDPKPECKLWWQMIAVEPEALGASSWKPRYGFGRDAETPPEPMFPGHVVIYRPEAVRMELWIRLMSLAYRYRNLPIKKRVLPMLGRGIATLLAQDLRNIAKAQLPILTFQIPWHILRAYFQFRRQSLTMPAFEEHVSRVLLHRKYRKAKNAVVVAVTDLVAFAKDIDSKREYEAAGLGQ